MKNTPASMKNADRHVIAIRSGAVGIIELSRPEKFNAMSRAAFDSIAAAMDEFEHRDSGVRAVLIRAQGKNFCTGGDLDEARTMMKDTESLDGFLRHVGAVLERIEGSPLPVVTACQGLTLAGGLELTLCSDIVFAASDARFGDQHVQYGLVPAWGATQRLPRLVGIMRSLDLMYSGRWIDAATALEWDLVSYVVAADQLREESMKYCQTLAARSRPGLAAMKRLVRSGVQASLSQGLRIEREAVLESMRGSDPQEGIEAFLARRQPQFSG
ncbi:Enoyl-CoA hydratase/isomerase [Paraburkholderia piptadeniae]|uniref:Enoyl-CoA hydratase/isomerase n=1 Tax=Paraburkholderia piptadeniae TaxID=1701573 RepID=A0A1N7S2V3_9BURK|nr:enoyl-CoA hydratase/isomerase family protein [Paraburkholderia piptadeniae]SIT41725.1 Enoyl-CoA hydratase/isomerase [Paraburkholderia piptadeniae]